jgi:molybdopterin converting factor subunit 1
VRIAVRLFASAREAAGGAERVEVDVPGERAAAADVLAALAARADKLAAVAARSRLAVNQSFATAETPVRSGDEVALIPPVGGG